MTSMSVRHHGVLSRAGSLADIQLAGTTGSSLRRGPILYASSRFAPEIRILRTRHIETGEPAKHAGVAPDAANDGLRSALRELGGISGITEQLAAQRGNVVLPLADVPIGLNRIVLGDHNDRNREFLLEGDSVVAHVRGPVGVGNLMADFLEPGPVGEVNVVCAARLPSPVPRCSRGSAR